MAKLPPKSERERRIKLNLEKLSEKDKNRRFGGTKTERHLLSHDAAAMKERQRQERAVGIGRGEAGRKRK